MRHLVALVNASPSSGGGSVGCRLLRELWNSLGNSPLYSPITSTGSTQHMMRIFTINQLIIEYVDDRVFHCFMQHMGS